MSMNDKIKVSHKIGRSYISYDVNDSKEASDAIVSFQLTEIIAKIILAILLLPFKIIFGILKIVFRQDR